MIIAYLTYIPGIMWWEKKSYNRLLKGFANPLRRSWVAIYVRCVIGYVCTFIIAVGVILDSLIDIESFWISLILILWWTTNASLYVLPVCDPLPPVTGKWKIWFASMLLKPANA